jgi:solute carrier family 8 (sodium/calcium exchanger)
LFKKEIFTKIIGSSFYLLSKPIQGVVSVIACPDFAVLAVEALLNRFCVQFLGLFLAFLFLGVAVVADVFMEAIEKITSKEKKLSYKDQTSGEDVEIQVQFWNPTVANLTLLALGSSAPEILLAVIETVTGLGESPGELGAATIVGSAAFNLLAITAVCIVVCPPGETRRVTQIYVFICTSIWSLFAYVWLIIALELWTPDEVTLVEAIITISCMAGLVLSAWAIDMWESKKSSAEAHKDGEAEGAAKEGWVGGSEMKGHVVGAHIHDSHGDSTADRNEITRMLRSLGSNATPQDAAKAMMAAMPPKPITRIQARINAAKAMTGKKSYVPGVLAPPTPDEPTDIRKAKADETSPLNGGAPQINSGSVDGVSLQFDSSTMICRESQGTVKLSVQMSQAVTYPVSVEYATIGGTAEPGKDFIHVQGTLIFEPGSKEEIISVTLIEDEEFEPDETFTVHLSKPTAGAKLGAPSQILIIVVDDHEPGQLGFDRRFYNVKESEEFAFIPVTRTYGSAGRVTIDYETSDGVAIAGKDYVAQKGTLVFEDGETIKEVKIPIILDETPDAFENFCVSLSTPSGGASMGKLNMCVMTILGDSDIDAVASTVAQLLRQRDGMLTGEGGSWRQQFLDAIELQGGCNELGETVSPSGFQAGMHCLSLFWKILFATIPPTDYCGGWATFGIALTYIGIVTAIVGDVAGQFGCVIGLKPIITAVTFVALGTSLPDLFASKQVRAARTALSSLVTLTAWYHCTGCDGGHRRRCRCRQCHW